jgi:nicotinamide riboside kinase
MTDDKMLVIDIYGGPGCGKSTAAAGIFNKLKKKQVECELVREYAKDLTWLESFGVLKNQLYVAGKQVHRQYMVNGKVDVIITDSPFLLSLIYAGWGCTPSFKPFLLEVYDLFDNMNFFLERGVSYNPNGRNQDEAGAREKDRQILDFLNENNLEYILVPPNPLDEDAVEWYMTNKILEKLEETK